MKCCFFKKGTILEIRESSKNDITYITFASDASNIYTATILVVNYTTLIVDEEYKEIDLSDLKIGDLIYVYHSPIMTMSIPPQTNAFIIELK